MRRWFKMWPRYQRLKGTSAGVNGSGERPLQGAWQAVRTGWLCDWCPHILTEQRSATFVKRPTVFLKHSFTFLKHGSLWTYRAATLSVLASGLIFFSLVLGLRYYLLPHIDEYREPIARAISASVGQRVTIGSLSGS